MAAAAQLRFHLVPAVLGQVAAAEDGAGAAAEIEEEQIVDVVLVRGDMAGQRAEQRARHLRLVLDLGVEIFLVLITVDVQVLFEVTLVVIEADSNQWHTQAAESAEVVRRAADHLRVQRTRSAE